MNHSETETSYGLMAQYERPEALLEAAQKAYAAGYRKLDAFSPVPIHGLAAAIGFKRTNLPYVVFLCGLIGAIAGYSLQYWIHVIDYPLNIGGRPLHSGPFFIPVTFETTILFAGISCFIAMLVANGLPRPYHPVFNVPGFSRASQDRFFLCVLREDPQYNPQTTKTFLEGTASSEVSEVAN